MGLESELKKFLSGYADKMKKFDVSLESKKNEETRNVDEPEKQFTHPESDGIANMAKDENTVGMKRKRECYLQTLDWLRTVAKDPCNPVIEPLPASKNWNKFGNEPHWKKILSVRGARLSQGNADVSSQHLIWKRLQKLHPVMYDDQTAQGLRCSRRIATVKESSRKSKEMPTSESSSPTHKQSKSTADSFSNLGKREKKVSVGPNFQAILPEFIGTNYESDSKWLGTRVWPLAKGEQTGNLIERDPIGKGRQESCGCQFQGSLECVRFHVRERRTKVKFELGSAFYLWKFDKMGEEVALIWTKDDESKFSQIVNANLVSNGKYFWEELFKIFSRKGREALVSYYFNVFLLRRRSEQNRNLNENIGSDDDESEYGPVANRFGQKDSLSPGSIFRSPKKPNHNR